jgi:transcriptional regulator with XRE-family HTH domain
MSDGQKLKFFIENQRISKQKIADDLSMTRSNLYQLFESRTLSDETRQKFENYFKVTWKDIDNAQLSRPIDDEMQAIEILAQALQVSAKARLIEAENIKRLISMFEDKLK